MKITKYKNTTYEISTRDRKILIDPGIFAFGEAEDEVEKDFFKDPDVLLLSHTHPDHFDKEAIKNTYQRADPRIYSHQEVSEVLKNEGIESVAMKEGQEESLDGITFTATRAAHKRPCIGFLIDDGENKLYYAADTFYLEDKPSADAAIVPLENRGIMMGPKEAAKFVDEGGYNIAIPSHYQTPKSAGTPEQFVEELKDSDTKARVLETRETTEI